MTDLADLLHYVKTEKGTIAAATIAADWEHLPGYPTLSEAEVTAGLEQLAREGLVRRIGQGEGELWEYLPEVPVFEKALF